MNKAKLVEEVSGEVGLSKRETQKVVDAILGTIGDTLVSEEKVTKLPLEAPPLVGGEDVTLVGFGTFQVAKRKARRGVNPQTRETIQIPAKRIPKFVPGKSLKEKVK